MGNFEMRIECLPVSMFAAVESRRSQMPLLITRFSRTGSAMGTHQPRTIFEMRLHSQNKVMVAADLRAGGSVEIDVDHIS